MRRECTRRDRPAAGLPHAPALPHDPIHDRRASLTRRAGIGSAMRHAARLPRLARSSALALAAAAPPAAPPQAPGAAGLRRGRRPRAPRRRGARPGRAAGDRPHPRGLRGRGGGPPADRRVLRAGGRARGPPGDPGRAAASHRRAPARAVRGPLPPLLRRRHPRVASDAWRGFRRPCGTSSRPTSARATGSRSWRREQQLWWTARNAWEYGQLAGVVARLVGQGIGDSYGDWATVRALEYGREGIGGMSPPSPAPAPARTGAPASSPWSATPTPRSSRTQDDRAGQAPHRDQPRRPAAGARVAGAPPRAEVARARLRGLPAPAEDAGLPRGDRRGAPGERGDPPRRPARRAGRPGRGPRSP